MDSMASDQRNTFKYRVQRIHPGVYLGLTHGQASRAVQALTGTKNSRLMCAPKSFTRSRNCVR